MFVSILSAVRNQNENVNNKIIVVNGKAQNYLENFTHSSRMYWWLIAVD